MIKVECPSCAAPYELDERRLPASGMNMRCPKCSATFPVRPPGAAAPPPAAAPAPVAPAPAAPATPNGARKQTMVGVGSLPPESFADLDLDSVPPPAPKAPARAIAPAFPAPAPVPPPPKAPMAPPVAPPARAPIAAPPPPAAAKKPIAPPFGGGAKPAIPAPADLGFKVPAPKAPAPAGGGLDLTDLPAPARPGGARGLDLEDLPAPKAPPPKPDLGLDLPALKRPAAPGGAGLGRPAPKAPAPDDGFDLDLPALKGASGGGFEVDLPAPKGASGGGFEVDLPAPKGASGGGFEVDLPAPKGPGAAHLDLDLPALKGRGAPPAPKPAPAAMPAPAAAGTPFDAWEGEGEVDLPAPRDELDLPVPKSKGFGDELDLPIPKVAGGFGDELDLPMPKAQSGFGDELDLPVSRGQADLPVSRGAAPAVKPAPVAAPQAPKSVGFDDALDFGEAAPAAGAELRFDDDVGAGADDFGDLEIPSLPPPSGPADDSLELDDLGSDDELSLPEPVARGGGPAPVAGARTGAGGTGFGELDLGGGPEADGLEFDDIPQEAAGAATAGAAPGRASRVSAAGVAPEKAAAPPKKKTLRGLIALATVLTILVGAGVSLRLTKYGTFGIYYVERFLPAAGDPAKIERTIRAAETKASNDTYADVRESLRVLARERRHAGLNRLLLTRSLVHESLYQARFGTDAASAGRAQRIRLRLEERSDDAPGIDLALAAQAVAARDLSRATRHLGRALQQAPSDPYAHLMAGELALLREEPAEAKAAFEKALEHGGAARARWGLARAALAAGDADAARAAVDATLEASPGHASALAERARLLWAAGEQDAAMESAKAAAGLAEVAGVRHVGAARERASAFTFLGEAYEHLGRRAQASAMYGQAVELHPFDVRALLGAGRALLLERRMRDALARFEAAEEALSEGDEAAPPPPEGQRPYAVQAKLGAVEALIGLERPQDARRMLAELERSRPDDPHVYLWQGRVAEVLGESEPAVALYRKAIELQPASFDGYNALARLYFAASRHDDAVAILDEATQHVPVSAEVRRMRGESELHRDHLADAVREFQGAVELGPNDTAARFGLGVAFRRSGMLAEASSAFEALAAIDAAYPGLSLERGKIYEAQGEAARAVRAYEEALEQTPEDIDLMLRLGGAQVMAGDVDAAERTLRAVIERRPDSGEAEYFMGRVAYARGQLNEAQTHFARAVQLDATRPEFHLYLAWVYFDRNDIGRAQSEVMEALQRDESLTEGYLLRAQLGVRTGAVRDALRDIERVVSLNPNRYEAYAVQGEAYAQLGERGDAVRSYRRAVAGDATNAKWWYRFGRVLYDHGDRGEAAAALDRSTQLGAAEQPMPSWLPEAHRLAGEVHQIGRENAAAIRDYQKYLELAGARATDRPAVVRALARLGVRIPEP